MNEDDNDAALAALEEAQRLLWEDQEAYEHWLDEIARFSFRAMEEEDGRHSPVQG